MKQFLTNYVARHQNRANQLFHIVGVPLAFAGAAHFLIRQEWSNAAASFVGGYVLQFLGHAIEGNDAGEVILIKKLLGLPYREFRPGNAEESKSDDRATDTN